MRALIVALSLTLALPIPARAQKSNPLNTGNTFTAYMVPFACEGTNCVGLTIDATAGGKTLTAANYSPTVTDQPAGFSQAQMAVCYNTGAKIWVSSNPNITLATARGIPIPDGGSFTIYGYANIVNFHAIRDAAVSSTLFCDYHRQP